MVTPYALPARGIKEPAEVVEPTRLRQLNSILDRSCPVGSDVERGKRGCPDPGYYLARPRMPSCNTHVADVLQRARARVAT
jgi:hypothetical protein